jgi:hypothetical protein
MGNIACYVLMTILSYRLCQKYYVIPYNLKRLGLYFGLAALFYCVDAFFPYTHTVVMYACKTVMIAIFVGIVYVNERRQLI